MCVELLVRCWASASLLAWSLSRTVRRVLFNESSLTVLTGHHESRALFCSSRKESSFLSLHLLSLIKSIQKVHHRVQEDQEASGEFQTIAKVKGRLMLTQVSYETRKEEEPTVVEGMSMGLSVCKKVKRHIV